MNPNITWLLFEISCGILTAPLGFGLFGYLLYIYQLNAAVWIFLSTILVIGTLHLNMLLFRQKLDEWYDPYAMENLKLFSIIVMSASIVATGIYIACGVVYHQDLAFKSHFASAIASISTLFFSSYFIGLSRRYKRYVEMCAPPLITNARTWRTY